MNRDTALRLVEKLRAVTTDRGATGPEAAVAAEKADALVVRFGLDRQTGLRSEQHRPRRARAAPPAGSRDWVGGSMFAKQPDWRFDARTGKGSPNVKVHEYKSRREWRIEIQRD